jgi:hypothetical protein
LLFTSELISTIMFVLHTPILAKVLSFFLVCF